MAQHFLNTTILWLISLTTFDLMLRKETCHKYNRIYLLATFILGLLLPFYSLINVTSIEHSSPAMTAPLYEITVAKQQVLATTSPLIHINETHPNNIDPALLILFIYITGVTVGTAIFINEFLTLVFYYKDGSKKKLKNWTLIETQESHGPFSFASYLFISKNSDYTEEQWNIVLNHEEQHNKHYHWIDAVLLQIAVIMLWFHPLVYAYRRRIRLVHEYQADVVGLTDPLGYSRFLFQSLLMPSPAITQSFTRSPIKNRIMMLTRSTSRRPYTAKMILIFPLLTICCICCSKSGESSKQGNFTVTTTETGKTIEINRNTIRFSQEQRMIGPGTALYIYAEPEQLNGKKLYKESDNVVTPKISETGESLQQYAFRQLKEKIRNQDDGIYLVNANNIVIDESGKLIYYELSKGYKGLSNAGKIDEKLNSLMKETLDHLPILTPALHDGKAVPFSYCSLFRLTDYIHISGQRMTLIDILSSEPSIAKHNNRK